MVLSENFTYSGTSQNFERDSYATLAEMTAVKAKKMPSIFHATCEETGKLYIYNKANSDDEILGKWREVGSGSINGGNADTVNNHTVNSDVPENAVFTDTVYDDTDIRAELAEKADAAAIPNKVSDLNNDSNYQTAEQVNNIVTVEIAKVVSDAPENLNTLKEMSDWIAGHENDASAMNSAISNNKTSIKTLQTNVSNINTSLDGKLNKTFIGDDVGNKVLSTDENGNVVLKDNDSNEGTAETTSYTNANYPDYTNVDLALNALFNKVYYVKPTCSLSVDKQGGTFEMGTVISAPITFNWTTNKDIKSQTLTDCTLADASVRSATYNTNVTADKSFTLSVSDGENFASSSVSYKFLNKVYYGSASEPNSYDSAFILGLANNKFATSIKGSYPITVESGEFGYIACPKSFNAPSECYIGGFLTTLENAGEISFTNASGGVATYTILKTGRSGLGSLTMEFK